MVSDHVGTRKSDQTRSHAQKFFKKLYKDNRHGNLSPELVSVLKAISEKRSEARTRRSRSSAPGSAITTPNLRPQKPMAGLSLAAPHNAQKAPARQLRI